MYSMGAMREGGTQKLWLMVTWGKGVCSNDDVATVYFLNVHISYTYDVIFLTFLLPHASWQEGKSN